MKKFLLLLLLTTPAQAGTLLFSYGGITYHGAQVNPSLAQEMDHKLDSRGKLISHKEELGIHYLGDFTLELTLLKDCFGEPAVVAGAGDQLYFGNVGVGYLLGIYARKRHYFIEEGKRYVARDLPLSVTNKDYELVPFPMLTASVKIGSLLTFPVYLLAGSNYFISHLQIGIGF